MKRKILCTTVAGAHLCLVLISAAGLLIGPGADFLGRAVRWYGLMSGAANRFGFFAEVGTGCRVTFTLTDADGENWQDSLDPGVNREAEMRFNGSIYKINEIGEPLARSWAATMLGRHPHARQVLVQFETYEVPSMAEFRAGQRPQWKVSYESLWLRQQ